MYVGGFVQPVPDANKDAYIESARSGWELFKEYGALSMMECWGDDVPEGKQTDFRRAVALEDGLDAGDKLARLQYRTGDPGGAAHKLKSACGTLGADALSHAAFEVERDAREGRDVTDAVEALDAALGGFRDSAEAALAALSPDGAPTPTNGGPVSG